MSEKLEPAIDAELSQQTHLLRNPFSKKTPESFPSTTQHFLQQQVKDIHTFLKSYFFRKEYRQFLFLNIF